MEKVEKSNINISVNGIVVSDVNTELNLARHTDDMHEIITKVPSWIVRWGIMLFFGILLIAVAISVLVRYPDTIKTELKIQSVNNSKSVITREPVTISKLLVTKNELVKKGQPLALINNPNISDKTIALIAPQDGTVAFIAIVQEGYLLNANQEVFRITPKNEQFFGVIQVHQNQISKVNEGQNVLIKLNTYPVEEYGLIKGKISYMADEPTKDGLFAIKVTFDKSIGLKKPVKLKNWMTATAEIITEDVSLQSRIYNSIVKGLNR